ncbi:androgen-dependent TFPI-regulating protein-like [Bufo gargarizans]|uniref:androgen-dependent TFPI-regulating protein-like n=1 Tax=Bufo gargarizans TaxID=30331 RepID=UPI001CF40C11|nr:androgen-dependent TFPI-regulating protein-like [Bufo gargarizans]
MAALGLVLHLGLLAWNVFAVYQSLLVSSSYPLLGHSSYGGRWKFLTFLNQVIQTAFFGVCLLCDLLQICLSNRSRFCSVLTRLKDCFFAALAFPLGAFVFTSFWSIYAYDRELVYPKELDQVFAQWLNHAMHTLIFPVILVELFACPHQYPSKKSGLAVLAVFGISYLSWVHWVHYAANIWAYPILAKLDAVGMLVFFASSFLIVFTFYLLGEWLTRLRWGSGRPARKKKKKSN